MIAYLSEYLLYFILFAGLLGLPGLISLRAAGGIRATAKLPGRTGLGVVAVYVLGTAIWTASLFSLAVCGQLRGIPVSLITLAWAAIGVSVWFLHGSRFSSARLPARPSIAALLGVLLLAALLVPQFILAASPRVEWDASVYHLTLPRIYLAHHGFRPVEFNVYSNWPLGTELLYSLAMLVKDYRLAKLVHFGFGLLTLVAVAAACRQAGRKRAGWLAALLFLANPIVLWEFSAAYVDLACTFFYFAAFIFMVRALDDSPSRRLWLLLSGLACGMLAGTKLDGLVGGGIVAVMLVAGLLWRRGSERPWRSLADLPAWFVVPWLGLALPWLVKSAWYTGNPVYPLLYGVFGGRDWSAALTHQFFAWQAGIGMGRSPIDDLLLPVRVILDGGFGYDHFDGRIAAWWIVLVPLALVFGRKQPMVRRSLAGAGLWFLFWSVSSQQMRLLIPALPFLAVAAALTVSELLGRVRLTGLRAALASGCLVVVAAGGLAWDREAYTDALSFVRELRVQGDPDPLDFALPIERLIDRRLPADARVLCLNVNRGFFLRREYLADSFFEASQIADWLGPARSEAEVRRLLAQRHVSYIFIEHRNWGIRYPLGLADLIGDPASARLIRSTKDGLFQLFQLKPAPEP